MIRNAPTLALTLLAALTALGGNVRAHTTADEAREMSSVTAASVTTRAASPTRVDCTAALQRAAARLQLHEETGNSEALAASRAAVEAARQGTACTVLADGSSPRTSVQAALQRLQLHEQLGNTQALPADRAALAEAQREFVHAEAAPTRTGLR
jgi:hypothetical protein